ncbi:MAG: YfcE family phosphodiesterase [Proteobacteria bacterium]|nr:YfcE family phosphodiesterase [Pseudomonadota bacterium]
MSTKIGLISDVHASPEPVKEALSVFQDEHVKFSICAGDIAGYGNELEQTLQLLVDNECQMILGNHDSWFLESPQKKENKWITNLYQNTSLTLNFYIEGKNVHVVHASPPSSQRDGIKLLDMDGKLLSEQKDQWQTKIDKYDYDVLVVGHTHQVYAEQLGSTLLINPGSTVFNHTCMILTLPEMDVQIIPLSDKEPIFAWNWGMQRTNV